MSLKRTLEKALTSPSKRIVYIDEGLTEIPPELGALVNLTYLNLYHNRIAVIPPELGALVNLTELCLSSNRISVIPPELGALVSLIDLNFAGNRIAVIPAELGALVNLNNFYLFDNQIAVENPIAYVKMLYKRNRLFLYAVLALECNYPIPSVLCHFMVIAVLNSMLKKSIFIS